jgi:hypothetical protein
MGRRATFFGGRDREHFVELLCMMVGRYRIILHAYVLMGNHFLCGDPHNITTC